MPLPRRRALKPAPNQEPISEVRPAEVRNCGHVFLPPSKPGFDALLKKERCLFLIGHKPSPSPSPCCGEDRFGGPLPNFNELACANLPNCERSARNSAAIGFFPSPSYWRGATNEFAAHRDQTKILGANVIREPPGSRTSPNSRSRYAASWGYTLWLARYYRSRPQLRPNSRPSVPHACPRMRYTR